MEGGWKFWPKHFRHWWAPVELHVPCREPIDHLMSQCNFRHVKFDCKGKVWTEVRRCACFQDRFGDGLSEDFSLKCFKFEEQFTGYIDYMSHKLQVKRKTPSAYTFRATNRKRDIANECIHAHENAGFRRKVVDYMLEHYPYYRFCKQCIGSSDDLLR